VSLQDSKARLGQASSREPNDSILKILPRRLSGAVVRALRSGSALNIKATSTRPTGQAAGQRHRKPQSSFYGAIRISERCVALSDPLLAIQSDDYSKEELLPLLRLQRVDGAVPRPSALLDRVSVYIHLPQAAHRACASESLTRGGLFGDVGGYASLALLPPRIPAFITWPSFVSHKHVLTSRWHRETIVRSITNREEKKWQSCTARGATNACLHGDGPVTDDRVEVPAPK